MEKQELEYWKAVTAGSSSQWVEDTITSLNGNESCTTSAEKKGVICGSPRKQSFRLDLMNTPFRTSERRFSKSMPHSSFPIATNL